MSPVYEYMGLTVGSIQSSMSPSERKPIYDCDITYGTNNEFGFDYLRDNMKMSASRSRSRRPQLRDHRRGRLDPDRRGAHAADHLGPPEDKTDKYLLADRVAQQLTPEEDFEVKLKEHQCVLTESGIEKSEKMIGVDSFYSDPQHMVWPHLPGAMLSGRITSTTSTRTTSSSDGEVIIVDEFTGRLMPGRRWSDGLHQAVEAKRR
jgi:preprotein translocase subunit SecA